MIGFSEIESNRFGLNIYRGKSNGFDLSEVMCCIREELCDIIIMRYPTKTLYEHYQLLNLPHCKVIHSDSLVYYVSFLDAIQVKSLKNEVDFEMVNSDNVQELRSIIPLIFENYQNHYYANPVLEKKKITEGYVEWAQSYVNTEEGKIGWIVKEKFTRRIMAFATCSFNELDKTCEGVLYGVMPGFSGRGIYSDLIRYTQNYFKDKGYLKMYVSTQLQNYTVQNVWNRSGFVLNDSWETYHIINTDRIVL